MIHAVAEKIINKQLPEKVRSSYKNIFAFVYNKITPNKLNDPTKEMLQALRTDNVKIFFGCLAQGELLSNTISIEAAKQDSHTIVEYILICFQMDKKAMYKAAPRESKSKNLIKESMKNKNCLLQ